MSNEKDPVVNIEGKKYALENLTEAQTQLIQKLVSVENLIAATVEKIQPLQQSLEAFQISQQALLGALKANLAEEGTEPLDDSADNDGSSEAEGNGNYSDSLKSGFSSVSPDDFILTYGLAEAIQLSQLDDGDAIQPNADKILMAIQDACAQIDTYISRATRSGAVLIASNRRRIALTIARYHLDVVRRRDDVKEDYERCLKELDTYRTAEEVAGAHALKADIAEEGTEPLAESAEF